MRYRIEYLTDPQDKNSVCRTRWAYTRDLETAKRQAIDAFATFHHQLGARGYQIRDPWDGGPIVATIRIDR